MWIANDWKEYEVIDASCGEKLERWGKYTLVRPDPQVIWDTPKTERGWKHMNDAIIMDPPSYGRGPKGEIWKIEDAIHPLVKLCVKLLSQDPLFFLINSYTTGLAPAVLTYMLSTELKSFNGHVDSQEIGLPVTASGLVLPCGASGRWESK